jgi:hypothetical protein
VTRALPLRLPSTRQVDAEQLYRGAASKVAAQRAGAPAEKSTDRDKSIEDRIEELEAYLRKFEPKR